ncbi:MAG: GNAT family N-acetyltransferase [Myxococcota bacterium]
MELTLNRYHLRLRRVAERDIEVIRQGRNMEHVRGQHVHQELITEAQQARWFASIQNERNYFFVIERAADRVGLVYVKDFTAAMDTSGCGVFLWDTESLGSRVPLLAVLTVLDFFFGELGGGGTESVVLRSNRAAMRMNEFFGFAFEEGPSPELVRIRMTKERYAQHRQRLLQFARRLIKDRSARDLVVLGAPNPMQFDVINALFAQGSEVGLPCRAADDVAPSSTPAGDVNVCT